MALSRPLIVVDDKIPFIVERLDEVADLRILPPEQITPETVRDADALLVRTRTRCNRDLLENSNVRLVLTATIGMDHFDREWMENNGIRCNNAAGCNAPGVAQYVWSSLLRTGFKPGRDKLGIVGYGNIGKIVYDWGKRMGVKMFVNDPPLQEKGCVDHDAPEFVPLDTLLQEADAVTFHVPLTREGKWKTKYLLGEKEASLLKPAAMVVNASRGGVTNENALLKAAAEKGVRLITDVWENEPRLDREFMEKSVISTPHIAGYSLEGKYRATRMVLEEIDDFFGVSTEKSGLTERYVSSGKEIDPKDIVESYDPFVDSEMLRTHPDKLEYLRDTYNFRPEANL